MFHLKLLLESPLERCVYWGVGSKSHHTLCCFGIFGFVTWKAFSRWFFRPGFGQHPRFLQSDTREALEIGIKVSPSWHFKSFCRWYHVITEASQLEASLDSANLDSYLIAEVHIRERGKVKIRVFFIAQRKRRWGKIEPTLKKVESMLISLIHV